jgi:hypothetical protein
VTFDDLRDLADSSGTPRAIVELSTSADEDDGADSAADDGPADAAAVESLAVWSYRHEDGALVNRRSVVVYDDAGPPRGGGGGGGPPQSPPPPAPPSLADPRVRPAPRPRPRPQPTADALCARRWQGQYQNLMFLSVGDYFSYMKVSPATAVAAAEETRAPRRAPERN